ncbi:uncharacterized protein LOC103828570 [Brassica rapa]|uniref:uncharacterized protein LOC103828570 n=1 Tax=Brassica campestris TaxID=3711 RepID=UPI00142E1542|nr:uncharacterized protein LOC103828570 [Brassica rapa]
MSKINNLDFAALNLFGDNYLQWALDAKIILKSKGLGECITEDNNASEKDRYNAILIIRHHLAESLKDQYLTIENPLDLWNELKSRYDHQRTVILPKARSDWRDLRIQDYNSVDEYNSALFKIVSKLKLCGESITDQDMLEKTFSTFHTSNVLLQQQCRDKGFKTYADLISCLLLAEQNNELLMRNSEMRPPGSAPPPEAHATKDNKESHHVQGNGHHGRGRGNRNGRGRGRSSFGCGQGNQHGRDHGRDRGSFGRGHGRGRGSSFKPQHSTNPSKSVCHRCGMGNHWAKTCRTPKHLVDLYQESLKGKNPEAHMTYQDNDFRLS